jgi:hypothetical protein
MGAELVIVVAFAVACGIVIPVLYALSCRFGC